eukprot:2347437-Amphidinium_carterae.2
MPVVEPCRQVSGRAGSPKERAAMPTPLGSPHPWALTPYTSSGGRTGGWGVAVTSAAPAVRRVYGP